MFTFNYVFFSFSFYKHPDVFKKTKQQQKVQDKAEYNLKKCKLKTSTAPIGGASKRTKSTGWLVPIFARAPAHLLAALKQRPI